MNRRRLTAVSLDARWAGTPAEEIGRAAVSLNAAGVDLLILGGPALGLDPLILAGWLAPQLSRMGLVTTLPALHTLPFHAARALSALDFMCGGLSGWAPTACRHKEQAASMGVQTRLTDEQALSKAVDFIDATLALWDSWDADALIIDKGAGVYLNADRVRRVHYRGPYFQVMGPLNAARPPQGYPVLVQSDADPLWRLTAGRADVILTDADGAERLKAMRKAVTAADGHARIVATLKVESVRSVSEAADAACGWLDDDLIDGVHLAPSGPSAVEGIIRDLLPALRQGTPPGLEGGTLRARLGLAEHKNAGPAPRVPASSIRG